MDRSFNFKNLRQIEDRRALIEKLFMQTYGTLHVAAMDIDLSKRMKHMYSLLNTNNCMRYFTEKV